MADVVIRDLRSEDLPASVELNNAEVPAVGDTDLERLTALVTLAAVSLVAERDGGVVGFSVSLGPGTSYGSVNYRWFDQRYEDFTYLDRIAVGPTARGQGVGAELYRVLETRIASRWLLCEVNLRPRNDGSLRFHARLGFVEVGQQETGYDTTVSLLAKELRPG